MEGTRRVFLSAARVSAATFAVVISSAALTVLTTARFGATRETDAFLVALAIPTMVGTVLALAPAVAAIPALVRVRDARGPAAARRLEATLFWGVTLTVAASGALLLIAREPVIAALAPGFDTEARALTGQLLFLTVPAGVALAGSNALTAILNANDRYALPAAAQMIVNAGVASVIIAMADLGVEAWAVGYLVGTVIAFATLVGAMLSMGQRLSFSLPFADRADSRAVLATVAPFVVLAAIAQASGAVTRMITSLLPGGVITALGIAQTLTNIPLGLSGYALGTTLVTAFAASTVARPEIVQLLFTRAIRILELLLAPVAGLMLVFSEPLVRALFERGAFTAESTALTAGALRIFALSLLAQPFMVVAHRALLGAQLTVALLVLGGIETAMLALLTLSFAAKFGHLGVAAAYSCSVLINAILLTIYTNSRFRRRDVPGAIGFTVAAAVMSAAAVAVGHTVYRAVTAPERVLDAAALGLGGLSAILVYVAAVLILPTWARSELRSLRLTRASRGR